MQSRNLKYLTFALIAALIIMVCAIANTKTAKARNATTQVVAVTIQPIRALYVDEQEKIVAIFNNVPAIADEEVQVFKSGAEIPVSSEIIYQYKKLLPRIDWSKIGWVYREPNPDLEASTKMQQEVSSEEIYSYSEKDFENAPAMEAKVSSKEIFDSVSKLNSSPSPPREGNYILRVTVVDAEDGLAKMFVDYLQ